MRELQSDDRTLLLHAALDGELDAVGMIEIEAELAADPALAAKYAGLVELRDAMRTCVPREVAPDALRARVISMARTSGAASPTVPVPRRARWRDAPYRSLAASLMIGLWAIRRATCRG